MKKELLRKNKLNFTMLLISAFAETGVWIGISLILEKVLFVATSDDINGLYTQLINGLVLFLITTICLVINIIVKPKFQKRAIKQYKNMIYQKLIDKSIENFNDYETSVYISTLTNDVKYIEEKYLFSIFTIITKTTMFISALVVMIIYSPLLTLISCVLSIAPLLISLIVGSLLSKSEERISDENGKFMHFVKDNLSGFSTIKVFQIEKKIKALFEKNNDKLETSKAKKTRVITILELLQAVSQLIAQLGVFFIGAYMCIKTNTLEASVLILFVQLMNYVIDPLATVPMLISERKAATPLFKKAEEMLKEHPEPEKEILEFNESIIINNVSLAYEEKQVLKGINLKFEKGKSYAIVGPSGSGKTTLLNLLSARSKEYSGSVYYDNIELKDVSLQSLYNELSFVEQNVFVFDDTIENNVKLYSKVEESVYQDILNKTCLNILLNEKGNEYKCGENGSALSGGEKQRISIARALLKNTKVLLMDEATSALDVSLTKQVMNNILNLKDMTKLVITHNLDSTILSKFDEIIVMSDGHVIETGTFDELVNKEGMFAKLLNFSTTN